MVLLLLQLDMGVSTA